MPPRRSLLNWTPRATEGSHAQLSVAQSIMISSGARAACAAPTRARHPRVVGGWRVSCPTLWSDDAVVAGTPFSSARLMPNVCRLASSVAIAVRVPTRGLSACPACGSTRVSLAAGRELQVVSVEVLESGELRAPAGAGGPVELAQSVGEPA
jgi:hypothetical protein